MRILISTDKLERGGKEKQLMLLAKGLLDRENEVRILSKNPINRANIYQEIQFPEDKVFELGKGNTYASRKRFLEINKSFEPSIILNFDVRSSLWTQRFPRSLKNIPAINCSIRRGTPYRSFKSRLLAKLSLRRSKYIVSNSEAGLRLYNIQKGKYHRVIHNGVDIQNIGQIKPKHLSQIFGEDLSDTAVVIANVASLYPHKNQIALIEAMSKLKNKEYYAFILGEGSQREMLQQKINSLGLNDQVKLIGRVNDVESYLKSASLYVNPSWGEGCPNAVLEAMACGLPVVTTANGGTQEVVHHDFTFFFQPNDVMELATTIEIAASNKKDINKNTILNWIEQFDINHMVDQYESFIKTVLSEA